MSTGRQATIRRLGPGDEEVVRMLADGEAQTALLADEATIFLAAFHDDEPVGFVFGYALPRRHGAPSILFVYELDVAEPHRRQGIAARLMHELAEIARVCGIEDGFVLTGTDVDRGKQVLRLFQVPLSHLARGA